MAPLAGSTPDLSVIIPCYNATETLGLQLGALAHQVNPPSFEVIVADNGSAEMPTNVIDEWRTQIPSLRLVDASAVQGTSYARNVGVAEAISSKIVFCDADDVVGPTFLRAAFEGLREAPVVSGNVQPLSGDEFVLGREHVWDLLERVAPSGVQPLDFGAPDVAFAYPTLMGGACALDRDTLVGLGGWDQQFFPGAEDNDLGLRVLAAGIPMGKSWGMTLAERRRSTGGQAFRRSYDAGLMHLRLCSAHDLWETSPHLRRPTWWIDLIKLPLAALKMGLSPTNREEKRVDFSSRSGLRLGQLVGFWRYKVRRVPVAADLGAGLSLENNR